MAQAHGENLEGAALSEQHRAFAQTALAGEWVVGNALGGGHQQGALEVIHRDGTRGVFKPADAADDLDALATKALAVERASSNGWPAANWIAWGSAGGRPWIVQRFAGGEAIETMSPPLEATVLQAVTAQAGASVLPAFDWSAHTVAIATPGSYWYQRCHHFGGGARALADEFARVFGRVDDPAPPSTDLVHGDFATDNILEEDGVITIIDTQSIGRGSRAVDLATMAVHCISWDVAPTSADRFFDTARAVAGDTAAVYAAGRALGVVVFAIDNYPSFVETLSARLRTLTGLDGWP